MATPPSINTSRIKAPVYVKRGDILSLNAHVSGFPEPDVAWFVGKKRVTSGAQYRLKQKGFTYILQIREVSDDIAQGVTILAENPSGRDHKFIECKLYKMLRKRRHIRRAKSQTLPPEEKRLSEPRKTIRLFRQGDSGSVKSLPLSEDRKRAASLGRRSRQEPEDVVYHYTSNISHGATMSDHGRTPRAHSQSDLLESERRKRISSTDDVFYAVEAEYSSPLSVDPEGLYVTDSVRRPTTPTRNYVSMVGSPDQYSPSTKENHPPTRSTVRQIKRKKSHPSRSPSRSPIRETRSLLVQADDPAYQGAVFIHSEPSLLDTPYHLERPRSADPNRGNINLTRTVSSAEPESPGYRPLSRKQKAMSLPPQRTNKEMDDVYITILPSQPAPMEMLSVSTSYGTIPHSPSISPPVKTDHSRPPSGTIPIKGVPSIYQEDPSTHNRGIISLNVPEEKPASKTNSKDSMKNKAKDKPPDDPPIIQENKPKDRDKPKKGDKQKKEDKPRKDKPGKEDKPKEEDKEEDETKKKKSKMKNPFKRLSASLHSTDSIKGDKPKKKKSKNDSPEPEQPPTIPKTEQNQNNETKPDKQLKKKKRSSKDPDRNSKKQKASDDNSQGSTDIQPMNKSPRSPVYVMNTSAIPQDQLGSFNPNSVVNSTIDSGHPSEEVSDKQNGWELDFIHSKSFDSGKMETTFESYSQSESSHLQYQSSQPSSISEQRNQEIPNDDTWDSEYINAAEPELVMLTTESEPNSLTDPVEIRQSNKDGQWDEEYMNKTAPARVTMDKSWDDEFLRNASNEPVWTVNGVKMSHLCDNMLGDYDSQTGSQSMQTDLDNVSDQPNGDYIEKLQQQHAQEELHYLVGEITEYTSHQSPDASDTSHSLSTSVPTEFQPLIYSSPEYKDRANSEPPKPLSPKSPKWHKSESAIGVGRRHDMKKHASSDELQTRGRPSSRTYSRSAQPSPGSRVRIKIEHKKTVTTESTEDMRTMSGSSTPASSITGSERRPHSSADILNYEALDVPRSSEMMSVSADEVFFTPENDGSSAPNEKNVQHIQSPSQDECNVVSPVIKVVHPGYFETDIDDVIDTEPSSVLTTVQTYSTTTISQTSSRLSTVTSTKTVHTSVETTNKDNPSSVISDKSPKDKSEDPGVKNVNQLSPVQDDNANFPQPQFRTVVIDIHEQGNKDTYTPDEENPLTSDANDNEDDIPMIDNDDDDQINSNRNLVPSTGDSDDQRDTSVTTNNDIPLIDDDNDVDVYHSTSEEMRKKLTKNRKRNIEEDITVVTYFKTEAQVSKEKQIKTGSLGETTPSEESSNSFTEEDLMRNKDVDLDSDTHPYTDHALHPSDKGLKNTDNVTSLKRISYLDDDTHKVLDDSNNNIKGLSNTKVFDPILTGESVLHVPKVVHTVANVTHVDQDTDESLDNNNGRQWNETKQYEPVSQGESIMHTPSVILPTDVVGNDTLEDIDSQPLDNVRDTKVCDTITPGDAVVVSPKVTLQNPVEIINTREALPSPRPKSYVEPLPISQQEFVMRSPIGVKIVPSDENPSERNEVKMSIDSDDNDSKQSQPDEEPGWEEDFIDKPDEDDTWTDEFLSNDNDPRDEHSKNIPEETEPIQSPEVRYVAIPGALQEPVGKTNNMPNVKYITQPAVAQESTSFNKPIIGHEIVYVQQKPQDPEKNQYEQVENLDPSHRNPSAVKNVRVVQTPQVAQGHMYVSKTNTVQHIVEVQKPSIIRPPKSNASPEISKQVINIAPPRQIKEPRKEEGDDAHESPVSSYMPQTTQVKYIAQPQISQDYIHAQKPTVTHSVIELSKPQMTTKVSDAKTIPSAKEVIYVQTPSYTDKAIPEQPTVKTLYGNTSVTNPSQPKLIHNVAVQSIPSVTGGNIQENDNNSPKVAKPKIVTGLEITKGPIDIKQREPSVYKPSVKQVINVPYEHTVTHVVSDTINIKPRNTEASERTILTSPITEAKPATPEITSRIVHAAPSVQIQPQEPVKTHSNTYVTHPIGSPHVISVTSPTFDPQNVTTKVINIQQPLASEELPDDEDDNDDEDVSIDSDVTDEEGDNTTTGSYDINAPFVDNLDQIEEEGDPTTTPKSKIPDWHQEFLNEPTNDVNKQSKPQDVSLPVQSTEIPPKEGSTKTLTYSLTEIIEKQKTPEPVRKDTKIKSEMKSLTTTTTIIRTKEEMKAPSKKTFISESNTIQVDQAKPKLPAKEGPKAYTKTTITTTTQDKNKDKTTPFTPDSRATTVDELRPKLPGKKELPVVKPVTKPVEDNKHIGILLKEPVEEAKNINPSIKSVEQTEPWEQPLIISPEEKKPAERMPKIMHIQTTKHVPKSPREDKKPENKQPAKEKKPLVKQTPKKHQEQEKPGTKPVEEEKQPVEDKKPETNQILKKPQEEDKPLLRPLKENKQPVEEKKPHAKQIPTKTQKEEKPEEKQPVVDIKPPVEQLPEKPPNKPLEEQKPVDKSPNKPLEEQKPVDKSPKKPLEDEQPKKPLEEQKPIEAQKPVEKSPKEPLEDEQPKKPLEEQKPVETPLQKPIEAQKPVDKPKKPLEEQKPVVEPPKRPLEVQKPVDKPKKPLEVQVPVVEPPKRPLESQKPVDKPPKTPLEEQKPVEKPHKKPEKSPEEKKPEQKPPVRPLETKTPVVHSSRKPVNKPDGTEKVTPLPNEGKPNKFDTKPVYNKPLPNEQPSDDDADDEYEPPLKIPEILSTDPDEYFDPVYEQPMNELELDIPVVKYETELISPDEVNRPRPRVPSIASDSDDLPEMEIYETSEMIHYRLRRYNRIDGTLLSDSSDKPDDPSGRKRGRISSTLREMMGSDAENILNSDSSEDDNLPRHYSTPRSKEYKVKKTRSVETETHVRSISDGYEHVTTNNMIDANCKVTEKKHVVVLKTVDDDESCDDANTNVNNSALLDSECSPSPLGSSIASPMEVPIDSSCEDVVGSLVDEAVKRCMVEVAEETMAKELVTDIVQESVHELGDKLQHLKDILGDGEDGPQKSKQQCSKVSKPIDCKTGEGSNSHNTTNDIELARDVDENTDLLLYDGNMDCSKECYSNNLNDALDETLTNFPPDDTRISSSVTSSNIGSMSIGQYEGIMADIKTEIHRLESVLLGDEQEGDEDIKAELKCLREKYKEIEEEVNQCGSGGGLEDVIGLESVIAASSMESIDYSSLTPEQNNTLRRVSAAGERISTDEFIKLEDMLRFGGCKEDEVREILQMVNTHLLEGSPDIIVEEEDIEEVKEEELDDIMRDLADAMIQITNSNKECASSDGASTADSVRHRATDIASDASSTNQDSSYRPPVNPELTQGNKALHTGVFSLKDQS